MEKKKICFLVGAADFGFWKDAGLPEIPEAGDLVISADAGRRSLLRLGEAWKPDYLIGDFDSLEEADPGASERLKEEYGTDCSVLDADGLASSDSGHLVLLPPEKNLTDLEAAWILGRNLGYHRFLMTGCFGGRRFDHSLGNLHLLLSIAKEGGQVIAASDQMLVVPLLAGQTFSSKREMTDDRMAAVRSGLSGKNRYLSLIPAEGDAKGVTIRGLKYELERGVLPAGSTLGLSNEIIKGQDFQITVESGSLWIVIEEKK